MQTKSILRHACACLPIVLALGTQSSHAQTLERHLPEAPRSQATDAQIHNDQPEDPEDDTTPLAANLSSIVLLGPNDHLQIDPATGITIGQVDRLQDSEVSVSIKKQLRSYLGKPLSRKVIGEISAIITKEYRSLNYPFVSVAPPPQKVDQGAIQIRIIEFHAGDIEIHGEDHKHSDALRSMINFKRGDSINARELIYDINAINRFPFRQVQTAFKPGSSPGESDMILSVTKSRPWQVYAGYGNDGSPTTTYDRYFVGTTVGGVLGHDSLVSLQATGSHDAIQALPHPHYQSVALSYSIPVNRRGLIESSANAVETYQTTDPFLIRLRATEESFGYRFALSKLYGDHGLTDARIGVEASQQTSTTYFGGFTAYDVSVESYKIYVGFHHAAKMASWDLSLHMSPGNVDAGNSDERIWQYSQGRLPGASYSYLVGSYFRSTHILDTLALKTQVTGQFTPIALPRNDQAALGGSYLVRGYSLDNGAVDTALIVRNELHFLTVPWRGISLDPYGFLDAGHGRDNFSHINNDLASLGAGANIRLQNHVELRLDAGLALVPNATVRPGDITAHTRLQFIY